MLPVARLHDPTFRVGKVILRLWIGRLARRDRLRAARLLPCLSLGLPLGLFGFVLLLLRCRHLLGPVLNDLPSLFQRRHPLFPPPHPSTPSLPVLTARSSPRPVDNSPPHACWRWLGS